MKHKQVKQLEQKQIVSQRQIQSLNILVLNNNELNHFQKETLGNPLIKLEFPSELAG